MPKNIPWSDDRDEELRKLWNDNVCAEYIGSIWAVSTDFIRRRAKTMGLPSREVGLVRSSWPQTKIDLLKQRWEEGISASIIALEFGTTRNAILGKKWRLGLAMRETTHKQPRSDRKPPKARVRARKAPVPPTRVVEVLTVDESRPGIDILALKGDSCRAIIGRDKEDKLARYCGDSCESGKSFCPPHYQRYYRMPDYRGGTQ